MSEYASEGSVDEVIASSDDVVDGQVDETGASRLAMIAMVLFIS